MPEINQTITVQFTLDKDRNPITLTHPLHLKHRLKALLGGCEPEDLRNVIALAPVKYAEKCAEIEPPLPDHLPIYSYEWGRSKFTIHRLYHNQPITIHLLTDADFAKWTLEQIHTYNLTHKETNQ